MKVFAYAVGTLAFAGVAVWQLFLFAPSPIVFGFAVFVACGFGVALSDARDGNDKTVTHVVVDRASEPTGDQKPTPIRPA